MIGFDLPLLVILAIHTVNLFTSRSSIYLYTLDQQFLVFSVVTFLLLGLYAVLSVHQRTQSSTRPRLAIVLFLGVFLLGSLMGIQIAVRHLTKPALFIHDGGVETEDAIAALRSGENPYAVDYSTRNFGAFPDVFSNATRPNPAWTHYIYLPFQLLAGIPAWLLANAVIGWFDIRLLYIMSFLLLVGCGLAMAPPGQRRLLTAILLIFNPLFVPFLIAGFNDVFFLGFVGWCAWALMRGRLTWAGVALGLAVASKQSAWFLVPFFIAHIFLTASPSKRQAILKSVVPMAIVAGLIILPFVIWSPRDFLDDTIWYASGSAVLSYPISGFGLGQLLLSMGVVRSMWDQYPFWIFQVIAGLPTLWLLLRWQRRQPSVSRMLLAYAGLAFVMWFVSRFFNDSYIGVLTIVLILAFAADREQART